MPSIIIIRFVLWLPNWLLGFFLDIDEVLSWFDADPGFFSTVWLSLIICRQPILNLGCRWRNYNPVNMNQFWKKTYLVSGAIHIKRICLHSKHICRKSGISWRSGQRNIPKTKMLYQRMEYNSRTATFSVEEYSFRCNVEYRRDQYSGPVAYLLELRESSVACMMKWLFGNWKQAK